MDSNNPIELLRNTLEDLSDIESRFNLIENELREAKERHKAVMERFRLLAEKVYDLEDK